MLRSAMTVVGSIVPTRVGELALRQPVLGPQHAQEIPLAARDAVGGDAPFQQPLERAVGVAHEKAGALGERKNRAALAPHAACARARAARATVTSRLATRVRQHSHGD